MFVKKQWGIGSIGNYVITSSGKSINMKSKKKKKIFSSSAHRPSIFGGRIYYAIMKNDEYCRVYSCGATGKGKKTLTNSFRCDLPLDVTSTYVKYANGTHSYRYTYKTHKITDLGREK